MSGDRYPVPVLQGVWAEFVAFFASAYLGNASRSRRELFRHSYTTYLMMVRPRLMNRVLPSVRTRHFITLLQPSRTRRGFNHWLGRVSPRTHAWLGPRNGAASPQLHG
jgi:hypothetical protein